MSKKDVIDAISNVVIKHLPGKHDQASHGGKKGSTSDALSSRKKQGAIESARPVYDNKTRIVSVNGKKIGRIHYENGLYHPAPLHGDQSLDPENPYIYGTGSVKSAMKMLMDMRRDLPATRKRVLDRFKRDS